MSIKKIAIIVLAVLSLITISYINATKANPNQLKVRQETLRSRKVNEDLDGFLIAYFSDMSYGDFFDRKKLERMTETVNSFKPDLIIFGGDLLEKAETPMSQEERDFLQESLRSLYAKYGKYAVLGDEDMASQEKVTNILEDAQFEVLNNEIRVVAVSSQARINIIGLNNSKNADPDPGILDSVDSSAYSLVISHCPDLFDEIKGHNVDYMCAGHSRNGQVYIPLVNFFYRDAGCQKYYRGKSTRNSTTLDISNGLGQRNYNARLNSDPEVVLYKFSEN
ncbi:MAG: hypothetical protein IIZ80_08905 [Erysipelotrichaceae bacterium]|nr:hypothetical protein [Erysipelotrichaceae bacterium]